MAELREAKCPNCGGSMNVDPQLDAYICQYCGTPFIVQKAIVKTKEELEMEKYKLDHEKRMNDNEITLKLMPWLVILCLAALAFIYFQTR